MTTRPVRTRVAGAAKTPKKVLALPKTPIKRRVAVRFGVPKGRLFVGSYHRVPVKITSGSTPFDNLSFVVPAGPAGGLVSPCRDRTFNPKKPEIMLLAGYRPGTYALRAINTKNNKIVGVAKFEVATKWTDEDAGPTRWFTGTVPSFAAGAAWGGGPAGPQNINVHPASGTRRIAILLVDTSTQRYTTDAATLQAFRDNWMNALVNGVTDAGITRSSSLFYKEVSLNTFDLSAQVFGPVNLPDSFDDYFNADGTPKGTFFQSCFTAGDGLIDYNNFDTLLCISQQVDGPPRKAAWPYASIGNWGPYTTSEGDKNYGVISCTNDWEMINPTRRLFEIISHELGHNLGLGDQYNPAVPGRNPGGWELMHADEPWPHFSAAHRMMLGWVSAGDVRSFNFQSMAAPVDETVTLHPIELGTLPAGRKRALEIRIADGWNYYFEYRTGQGTQIGDRSLPTDSRVLGTDVASPPYSPPFARPAILLLNNDVDGDGAILGNGTDYEETDSSDPVFPTDFKVDVSGIDGSKADVRIRYGVNSRPDPSIRPWPAGPDRQWQSPDIEVRNAKNMADPVWFNVPWVSHDNTVIASVKNNGALDAPAVRVNFYVKNYNVGGAPEAFIGFDQKDVAAGATVEFQTNWVPPSDGHFCVIARIPLYQLPSNPAVVEMTELNNIAQSNYDRFISATASPPSREMTTIEVGNPFPERTRIWIGAGHSNPMYRTYLEHSWVYLNPGETRKVGLMFEFAPDNLTNNVLPKKELQRAREMMAQPNNFVVASYIEDPRDHPRHAIWTLGGAQAQIVTGKATRFANFYADGPTVGGAIVTVDGKTPVRGGKAVVRITAKNKPGPRSYETFSVKNSGEFSGRVRSKGDEVQAFYVPAPGYGECESAVKPLRR